MCSTAISVFENPNENVKGNIIFHQCRENKKITNIQFDLYGLKPNSTHAIHIHEYGDLREGCKSTGGHYNPFNKTHGGPLDQERHVGDMGNLKANTKVIYNFYLVKRELHTLLLLIVK